MPNTDPQSPGWVSGPYNTPYDPNAITAVDVVKDNAAVARLTAFKVVTVSTTLAVSDATVIGNGATITLSLADPTTVVAGTRYTIKNVNASVLTVNSAGTTKTLDGAASQGLAQWAKATYISDGTQWLTV